MNILDKIIAHKHLEVAERKQQVSIAELEKRTAFTRDTFSFSQHILAPNKNGIISEFKRKSPSQGFINAEADVQHVTQGYVKAGASALSILTDTNFFAGKDEDVIQARPNIQVPILRKDFIIDEYQLIEAKSIGADVVLLIAECLEKNQLQQLAKTARGLGLEVLMEIHSADQLDKYSPAVNAVGVNNRNLKTFEVSIQHSLDILPQLPTEAVKISESGLSQSASVAELKKAGFNGFLVGTHFMGTANPPSACKAFIDGIQDYL